MAKGLEVLGVQTLISNFPAMCRSVLVSDGIIDGGKVTSILRPHPTESALGSEEHQVWQYLLSFINNASEEGDLGSYKCCENILLFHRIEEILTVCDGLHSHYWLY